MSYRSGQLALRGMAPARRCDVWRGRRVCCGFRLLALVDFWSDRRSPPAQNADSQHHRPGKQRQVQPAVDKYVRHVRRTEAIRPQRPLQPQADQQCGADGSPDRLNRHEPEHVAQPVLQAVRPRGRRSRSVPTAPGRLPETQRLPASRSKSQVAPTRCADSKLRMHEPTAVHRCLDAQRANYDRQQLGQRRRQLVRPGRERRVAFDRQRLRQKDRPSPSRHLGPATAASDAAREAPSATSPPANSNGIAL